MRTCSPIRKAIIENGGPSLLSERLGVTKATLNNWARKGRVDAKSVIAFHKLTKLPLNLCNPDLYPMSLGLVIYEEGGYV